MLAPPRLASIAHEALALQRRRPLGRHTHAPPRRCCCPFPLPLLLHHHLHHLHRCCPLPVEKLRQQQGGHARPAGRTRRGPFGSQASARHTGCRCRAACATSRRCGAPVRRRPAPPAPARLRHKVVPAAIGVARCGRRARRGSRPRVRARQCAQRRCSARRPGGRSARRSAKSAAAACGTSDRSRAPRRSAPRPEGATRRHWRARCHAQPSRAASQRASSAECARGATGRSCRTIQKRSRAPKAQRVSVRSSPSPSASLAVTSHSPTAGRQVVAYCVRQLCEDPAAAKAAPTSHPTSKQSQTPDPAPCRPY